MKCLIGGQGAERQQCPGRLPCRASGGGPEPRTPYTAALPSPQHSARWLVALVAEGRRVLQTDFELESGRPQAGCVGVGKAKYAWGWDKGRASPGSGLGMGWDWEWAGGVEAL